MNTKLKRKWYKLIGKEIYCYNSKDDINHVEMHNLTGVFIQRDKDEVIEGVTMFSFCIYISKKKFMYLSNSEDELLDWIDKLEKVVGFTDIFDIYKIDVNFNLIISKN